MMDIYYMQAMMATLAGIVGGSFVFMIIGSPFLASLLWTFGVHFARQEEDKYVSYLGVASLCTLTWFVLVMLCVWIVMESMPGDPRGLIFGLSFLVLILQSFLSILFGKLIWKGTWGQSCLTWMNLLILFLIAHVVFWVNLF